MENWPLALYIKALIAILLIAPLERFRTFCWRRRLVVALLGLMAAGTVQAATCTSQGSGNWNTAATWKCPTTANFSNVGTFTDGSKVQKTRPCAVVSPTEMHDHLRTVMVAPMTTRAPPAGFPVSQTFQGQSGLVDRKSVV